MTADARRRRTARALLPLGAYALLIFGLSAVPGSHVPQVPIANFDKVEHLLLYGLFGLLAARALRILFPSLGAVACVLLVAYLVLLYGTTDEVHQLFTPGRSCDPLDALADLTGGTLGAMVFLSPAGLRALRSRIPGMST